MKLRLSLLKIHTHDRLGPLWEPVPMHGFLIYIPHDIRGEARHADIINIARGTVEAGGVYGKKPGFEVDVKTNYGVEPKDGFSPEAAEEAFGPNAELDRVICLRPDGVLVVRAVLTVPRPVHLA